MNILVQGSGVLYAKEVPGRFFSQQWACLAQVCAHTHTQSQEYTCSQAHIQTHSALEMQTWRYTHIHTPCIQLKTRSFCHSHSQMHAHMPEHVGTFSNRRVSLSSTLTHSTQIPTHSHPHSVTHTCTHTHSFTFLKPCINMLKHPYTVSQMHTQWIPHRHPKPRLLGCPPFLKP